MEHQTLNLLNDVGNEIIYNTEVLKSILCDYNDTWILVGADMTVTAAIDLVKPMYSLIKYSSSCSETTGSLWFYSKDETTNSDADIANTLLILNLSRIRLNYQKTLKLNLIQIKQIKFYKKHQLLCH